MRDAKPDKRRRKRGEGGSCTERRGVVIAMTGGVEGAERGRKSGASFFAFFLFFFISYIRC